MYLLVGLGNPGLKYKKNRHNVGHMAIDMISKKYNLRNTISKKFGEISKGKIFDKEVMTLKPKEYMNLSGSSVTLFMNFYKINIKNVYAIYGNIYGKKK